MRATSWPGSIPWYRRPEATDSAFSLRERLEHHHTEPALHFGFGISTGEAVVGNVGSEALMNYTAIGDTVNVAFRLQEHAQEQQILLSRPTYDQVRDSVEARPMGRMRIKSRAEEAEVYEALSLKSGESEDAASASA